MSVRLLGEKLSGLAAHAAAAAAPDGYTLLMTGNNAAIAVAVFKSLPYNVLTNFA